MRHSARLPLLFLVAALAVGCPTQVPDDGNFAGNDGGSTGDTFLLDSGAPDAGAPDSGTPDSGAPDAGAPDTGTPDSGTPDSGTPDSGMPDAGAPDSGTPDAGTPDAGAPDAGAPDAGAPDAGQPCASNVCDDGNPCTVDSCLAKGCAHSWVADKTPCGAGTCRLGQCVASPGWASDVVAGYATTCAIGAGKTWCWGDNTKGEIGGGAAITISGVQEPLAIGPTPSTTSLVMLDMWQQHVCRLSQVSSGAAEVHCWGDNYWTQLAQPAATSNSLNSPTLLAGAGAARRVCTGQRHTCVARMDGTVWCVGNNGDGQLGDGGVVGKTSKLVQVKGIDDALDVACGGLHTCAIRAGGQVWCWGENEWGQLGQGPGTAKEIDAPVQVKGLEKIHQLALGAAFTCARDATKVWCWGRNHSGQLGNGSFVSAPVPVEVKAGGASMAAAWIAAGQSHACIATPGGAVWCWGANSYHETAPEGVNSNNKVPKPTKRADITGALRVAAGHNHTCALATDGSLRCWGAGGAGNLGDGKGKGSETAVLVKGSKP